VNPGILVDHGNFVVVYFYTVTADFTEQTPFTVTFASGTAAAGGTMNAMIATVVDSVAEGDEDFMVSIISTSPTVTIGSPSSVPVTIIDDDRKSEV